ncbi:MAG: cation:proton antiporter [Gammaproteobacteria bacterium]|jgi:CPA2 family monovalent cation:H+ antiporter-2|nr:cation:proton antiporter [Gammaproteobacteria bacterium]
MQSMPLVSMIVAGFGLAFILGMIANHLKLSPIVGYLLAGVLIGPATPGYNADMKIAHELAEIGVILLMFGVGLQFSWENLVRVKNIALPGALCQILIAILMGCGLAHFTNWTVGAGFIFGLSLSVASTVVLLRALEQRNLLKTKRGQIGVGWLIVEDLIVVIALVVLPAMTGILQADGSRSVGAVLMDSHFLQTLGLTIFKVGAFIILMLVVGKRVIPWVLRITEKTKSSELFILCIISIALGVAYGAAKLFGVSFALGAFFAGMILSESEFSQKASRDSLPLRDAFAVLFFVAMGMLLSPTILITKPLLVLSTVSIIVLGKSLAAYLIVIAFGYPKHTAITISVSLAQIGEFSFILADLGVKLKILSPEGQDVILAGAIISILLNPILFNLLDRYQPKQIKEHSA